MFSGLSELLFFLLFYVLGVVLGVVFRVQGRIRYLPRDDNAEFFSG